MNDICIVAGNGIAQTDNPITILNCLRSVFLIVSGQMFRWNFYQ